MLKLLDLLIRCLVALVLFVITIISLALTFLMSPIVLLAYGIYNLILFIVPRKVTV